MFTDNYVIRSLELHLFFGRIMKEHSLFLKAGFTPANPSFIEKADYFMNEFEKMLCHAVELADGVINHDVIHSGELVTEFTCLAEKETECLTGIKINREITEKEQNLNCGCRRNGNLSAKHRKVQMLNKTAIMLLDGLISFKEEILGKVLCGKMFTVNYPLLIEHIIREAKLYRKYVKMLEKDGDLNYKSMRDIESFWNQIMMEHALFIRGLLDPFEKELFCKSDEFAKNYCDLLEKCKCAQDKTFRAETLQTTREFRDFKAAGTQGIEKCEIRSIILPLLADHVLREANHYIRLLQC